MHDGVTENVEVAKLALVATIIDEELKAANPREKMTAKRNFLITSACGGFQVGGRKEVGEVVRECVLQVVFCD